MSILQEAMWMAVEADYTLGVMDRIKITPACAVNGIHLHHQNINHERNTAMSVARVTEITSSSTKSFEDAIQIGISRANKTLTNVKGAWIQDQKVVVENGKITEYRVNMKVTFVLKA
jgi:flavin-binding protein dodecin